MCGALKDRLAASSSPWIRRNDCMHCAGTKAANFKAPPFDGYGPRGGAWRAALRCSLSGGWQSPNPLTPSLGSVAAEQAMGCFSGVAHLSHAGELIGRDTTPPFPSSFLPHLPPLLCPLPPTWQLHRIPNLHAALHRCISSPDWPAGACGRRTASALEPWISSADWTGPLS